MHIEVPSFVFNFYRDPPVCPNPPDEIEPWFAYPSIATESLILAIMSITFSIVIAFKYNSVKVFNKKVFFVIIMLMSYLNQSNGYFIY